MATGLTVRPVIAVVMTTAIMLVVVFFLILGGDGCSRRRTDGTTENSTLSTTYLIADGGSYRSANTATERGVCGVVRNDTQRGSTQR